MSWTNSKYIIHCWIKLLILNCPFVEKLFKLLNIAVDVAFELLILNWWVELIANILFIVEFKLLMLNCPFVEKLFKLLNIVVDVL